MLKDPKSMRKHHTFSFSPAPVTRKRVKRSRSDFLPVVMSYCKRTNATYSTGTVETPQGAKTEPFWERVHIDILRQTVYIYIFIFINHVFFICALKGLSIKRVVLYILRMALICFCKLTPLIITIKCNLKQNITKDNKWMIKIRILDCSKCGSTCLLQGSYRCWKVPGLKSA